MVVGRVPSMMKTATDIVVVTVVLPKLRFIKDNGSYKKEKFWDLQVTKSN